MNKFKTYEELLAFAKNQIRSKDENHYYESHHIVPKHMNGTDDPSNLILLTLEEHIIAHYLIGIESNDIRQKHSNFLSALLIINPKKCKNYKDLNSKKFAVESFLNDKNNSKLLKALEKTRSCLRPWQKSHHLKNFEFVWYQIGNFKPRLIRKGLKGEKTAIDQGFKKLKNCPICGKQNSNYSFACCKNHEEEYNTIRRKNQSSLKSFNTANNWKDNDRKERAKKSISIANSLSKKTKGGTWYTNGTENLKIKDEKIPKGFTKGFHSKERIRFFSDETRKKISESNKLICSVYKDDIYEKRIQKSDLQNYLDSGWIKGKNPKFEPAHKKGYKQLNRKPQHWITNGIESKLLLKSEQIPLGFHPGRTI